MEDGCWIIFAWKMWTAWQLLPR